MAEKDKRCQIGMVGGIPCGGELYDEKHCIFHSKKFDKNVKLFQKKIDQIFQDNSLLHYDFSDFIFPEGVLFPGKIDREINFGGTIFQGKVYFEKITFQKRIDFADITFQGEVGFTNVIFEDFANFMRSVFKGDTFFSAVIFKDIANFFLTSFQNRAYFFGVVFLKAALFSTINFKQKVSLKDITIQDTADFSGSIFEDALKVDGETNNRFFSNNEVDFRYVKFFQPEKVYFRKLNLSKVRFSETDLRKVEFIDVDWDKRKGRCRIYDEVMAHPLSGLDPLRKPFDYPLIAQVYKRLRANYEENLNYAEAGDFHIGEMEMRRKGEKNPFNKAVIWLYKLISNYGESYRRPLGWIALLLLVFPLLYMLVGIVPSTQINGSQSFERLKDYWSSFTYSLSVFSLVRERPYHTINNLGHFFTILESIFSPVLIAFFLLALRRRFKR